MLLNDPSSQTEINKTGLLTGEPKPDCAADGEPRNAGITVQLNQVEWRRADQSNRPEIKRQVCFGMNHRGFKEFARRFAYRRAGSCRCLVCFGVMIYRVL
ncbi:MAG: hypothetical protein DMG40_23500 [Acidobacteria bacterium]|nr:MAG: hypothetical protein DMG40_23500 [Acidobacteriota bacterium]